MINIVRVKYLEDSKIISCIYGDHLSKITKMHEVIRFIIHHQTFVQIRIDEVAHKKCTENKKYAGKLPVNFLIHSYFFSHNILKPDATFLLIG